MRFVLVVLLASSAIAQTGGGDLPEFPDTLRRATDVLVGDIVAGSATDDGTAVRVQTRVRVVRVLQGAATPGSELSIGWDYKPAPWQPPSVTTKVPLVRTLLCLRRDAAGRLEVLRTPYGASTVLVSLPAVETSASYPSGAALQYKVAREIGAALEEMASRDAATLVPRELPPLNSGVRPEWANVRNRFTTLAVYLDSLDRSATSDVYARLSTSPDPNLKAVGLQGRYNQGDASAPAELERQLAVVAPVFNVGGLRLRGSWLGDSAAAHVLGRIALAETPLSEVESSAPGILGATGRPEFLPYLNLMLDSPDPMTRGRAVLGICQLLRRGSLWRAEMSANCPNIGPVGDPEEEQRLVRYWSGWWDANRETISRDVVLPRVIRPARYDTSPVPAAKIEPTIETGFSSHAMTRRYADKTGRYLLDMVAMQLTGNDIAVWKEVLAAAGLKFEALMEKGAAIRNAARVSGTPPDDARRQAFESELRGVSRASLDELRGRLTSGAWQIVETTLTARSFTLPLPAGNPK